MHIVSISGSPQSPSRSAWLLQAAERRLAGPSRSLHRIVLRELPAQPLLLGEADAPALRDAIAQVAQADLVIVATPIYKAAYSGLLKVFLDLLPQDALRGKTVLPLASGGSSGHLLALEYTLKPVLSALGARHILDAQFVVDTQLVRHPTEGYVADASVTTRLERALATLGADEKHQEGAHPSAVPLRAVVPLSSVRVSAVC
jgi:FMN reductase